MFSRTTFLLLLSLLTPGKGSALIDTFLLSGNPAAMVINSATAGGQPISVSNSATTYTIETNLTATRVVGQLNSAMPAGVTLKIQLAAPLTATSQGLVTMSTTAQNLVTNLFLFSLQTGLAVTYQLSATTAAAPQSLQTRTVTFTIL